MRPPVKIYLLLLFLIATAPQLRAQFTVRGTVFDSSRKNYVENVLVQSTGGGIAHTDSMGNYKITVTEKDSINFTYQNKPTQKFAVKDIASINQFDISLRVHVKGSYRTMKEVVVFTKSYREDSLENRQTYSDVYNYHSPTLKTSISPGGVPGADLDEIINMFRFKRNKRLKAFQNRLEQQEQDHYVDYRFNKNFVRRITGLQGNQLDTFMVRYRPSYEFTVKADEVSFNKYILNSSYVYKLELLKPETPKLQAQ